MVLIKADLFNVFSKLKDIPLCLAIGVFDGIHKGHRAVLEKLLSLSALKKTKSAVFTFDRNPKSDSSNALKEIKSFSEKYKILEDLGIDYTVELIFSDDIKKMSGDWFCYNLIKELNISSLVCGSDFKVGNKNSYLTAQDIKRIYPSIVKIIDLVTLGGLKISSSRIRKIIEEKKEDYNEYIAAFF